jgi:hypothetical protein
MEYIHHIDLGFHNSTVSEKTAWESFNVDLLGWPNSQQLGDFLATIRRGEY